MNEIEFLENLNISIQERVFIIDKILRKLSDSSIKSALANNHIHEIEELKKIQERLLLLKESKS